MTKFRIFAVAAAAWMSISAAPAQTFTMKISSPTVNDLSQEWAKTFKAGIEARSNGRIKVEFYPANQLGQIPATVEGTALGTIEAVVPASGFFIGLEPRFQVFDAPGLFNDMAHAQRVFSDPEVRKQLATLGSSKGVEPLAILPHGPLMLLSHKPIRAVADFKGQKIRVPGAAPLQIEPFKKLGAAPVSMPLGEVLSAMQNRTIDGLIASATVFTAFKYYDLAKGLTSLPGSFLIAVVMGNKNFLKSMGPELEAMVREEAFKAQQGVEKFAIEDAGRTADIWKKNGGEMITLPDAEAKSYLDQVKSALPAVLNANPAIKADFDVLSGTAQRLAK
jgi:C4-dicarboxylate-binding protein DctP